jgi:hypothetical protein
VDIEQKSTRIGILENVGSDQANKQIIHGKALKGMP